jgi:DNA-binding XRE family transcriptional regulator
VFDNEVFEDTFREVMYRVRKNIFYLRKRANKMTLDQLAEDIDMSRDSIFKLENDIDRAPNLKTIMKICAYFGVSIGDMVEKDIERDEMIRMSDETSAGF